MKTNKKAVNTVSYPNPFSTEKENVIIYGYKNSVGSDTELFYQIESLRTFCTNNNFNIVMEVAEKGVQNISSPIRPLQDGVISFCENCKDSAMKVDKIIVTRMDRLSRKYERIKYLIDKCNELGIKLCASEYEVRFDEKGIFANNEVAICCAAGIIPMNGINAVNRKKCLSLVYPHGKEV